MKFVETAEVKTFKPVTLVIETEAELRHLWHLSNVDGNKLNACGYTKGYNFVHACAYDVFSAMDAATIARGISCN